VALTDSQADYIDALSTEQQIITIGPAGTGKTFIAATYAADCLLQHKVRKVILARPNEPAGRSLGFLPGTMEEKIAPWAVPITSVMEERMGAAPLEIALKRKTVEIVPFEVMRGRSWDNALIILDEAQNTTPGEMKLFLTRVGEDTQVIINGDISQQDIKGTSGLKTVIDMVHRHNIPAAVIEFSIDEIVRSGVCAMWVRAFHKEGL
jgi:phosphate starvation-inducible PhoH-like protein